MPTSPDFSQLDGPITRYRVPYLKQAGAGFEVWLQHADTDKTDRNVCIARCDDEDDARAVRDGTLELIDTMLLLRDRR